MVSIDPRSRHGGSLGTLNARQLLLKFIPERPEYFQFPAHDSCPLAQEWVYLAASPGGGMADAAVLGTVTERCVGSTPTLGIF